MYALFAAGMNGFLQETGTGLKEQYHVPVEKKR